MKKNSPKCFYCGQPTRTHNKLGAEHCLNFLSNKMRELTGFYNDDEMRENKN